MDFFGFISLFGGLALFLYGMSVLGGSLEKASEGRLERILERLTGSVIKGVLLGAVVTAAIQSSSAATVIVVGLVNARVMKLRQAIGVIMGANIGTTITGHILRLSGGDGGFLLRLISPSTLAPAMAIAGILLFMLAKGDRLREVGQMLLGFGVLFTGMFQMEAAVEPLRELPAFLQLFQAMTNPVLGVLVGAGVTAVIQSSSASVGILQALSSTGAITWAAAVPIILGQNIGTCVTPMLASVGASKSAKRAALIHLTLNLLGTGVFLCGIYGAQRFIGLPFWGDVIDKGGIANFHTIFNVAVTVLFLPFVGLLERCVYLLVPQGDGEGEGQAPAEDPAVLALDPRLLVSPGLALEQAHAAACRMAVLARDNFSLSREMILTGADEEKAAKLLRQEKLVDTLQDRVEGYLIQLSRRHLTEGGQGGGLPAAPRHRGVGAGGRPGGEHPGERPAAGAGGGLLLPRRPGRDGTVQRRRHRDPGHRHPGLGGGRPAPGPGYRAAGAGGGPGGTVPPGPPHQPPAGRGLFGGHRLPLCGGPGVDGAGGRPLLQHRRPAPGRLPGGEQPRLPPRPPQGPGPGVRPGLPWLRGEVPGSPAGTVLMTPGGI